MIKSLLLAMLIILAFPMAYRAISCSLDTGSWSAWKSCVSAGYKNQLNACEVR